MKASESFANVLKTPVEILEGLSKTANKVLVVGGDLLEDVVEAVTVPVKAGIDSLSKLFE